MRIKQKLDEVGRVHISEAMREEMGWQTGDELVISNTGKYIMVQRSYDTCLACGTGRTALIPIGNKYICRSCVEKALQKGW